MTAKQGKPLAESKGNLLCGRLSHVVRGGRYPLYGETIPAHTKVALS